MNKTEKTVVGIAVILGIAGGLLYFGRAIHIIPASAGQPVLRQEILTAD